MGSNPVDEHTFTTARGPVHYRTAAATGVTPLYLHGVPTSSEDWVPFLERTGGIAPDLIGFGRSSKGGHLDYSLEGLATFVEELLDELGIERVSLVAHQWGAAAGLVLAARRPERVERLVLLNPLPLVAGFRWPRVARWWRRPVVGELLMGSTGRRMLNRALRHGTVEPDAWPRQRLAVVWDQFDQGTQRAILRLHRQTAETALEGPAAELEMPAVVIWGDSDPWLTTDSADALASRLHRGSIEHLAAGHWPWLDRPEVVDRVHGLLGS